MFQLFLLRFLVIGSTLFALWHSRTISIESSDVIAPLFSEQAHVPIYRERRIDNGGQASVHSATLAKAEKSDLIAFWFGGSREGAQDVAIYQSTFSRGKWQQVRVTITREKLQKDLGRYVRKLGNPVAYTDSRGRIHLFFVSVSVGGWSGSSINHIWSDNNGVGWSKARRLITSPFLNISTLVRSVPIEFTDGSLLLPAYHEFITKFSQLIRIDSQGTVVSVQTIAGNGIIQPAVCTSASNNLYMVGRDSNKDADYTPLVQVVSTSTIYQGWKATTLHNPDSSISCLQIGESQWLLVGNSSKQDRSTLSFATSVNPLSHWSWQYDLEKHQQQRFSYPALLRDNNGTIHLLYSENRKRIKHIEFNRAWMNEVKQ